MATQIEIIYDDITNLRVDAIVNAANTTLLGGGGVDGAIHRKAGKELFNECSNLGGCAIGEAKITKAYNLPAQFVIHTVGPIFSKNEDRSKQLYSAYQNSLLLAKQYHIKTIAFPNISTGIYKYPKELASKIAIDSVSNFIKQYKDFEKIIFCCYDEENYNIYKKHPMF